MDKGLSGMRREMFMKESSETTRLTGTESTSMSTAAGTKDTGKMTCRKAKAKKFGVTELITRALILWAESMVSVLIAGLTVQNMKETGLRIELKAMGSMNGLMVGGTKESG